MHDYEALAARMERLERMVEDLARRLPAAGAPHPGPMLAASEGQDTGGAPLHAAAAAPPVPRTRAPAPAVNWDGQLWLNRMGIGLLLLGVAFLFRYSVEMGWTTPPVRVAFGAAVGVTLLAAGLRMGEKRRFGPVRVGGGVAVFYIVGWAAFVLYSMVGYTSAFAGMIAVTALAFGLALRKNEPALGILGAVGGLGTPLLLGMLYGSPRTFALYTCAIIGWTAVLHLQRSWRWVLWTTLSFGWVLLCAYAVAMVDPGRAPVDGRGVLQTAGLFAFACTGLLPLAVRLRARGDGYEPRWKELDLLHWYGVALVPSGALLLQAAILWSLSGREWGAAAAAGAALYGAAAAVLWRRDLRLARVLALATSVMATAAMVAALDGNLLLAGLAAQSVALLALAERGRGGLPLRWMAHKAYAAAGLWLLVRLVDDPGAAWGDAATALVVLGSGFASSYLARTRVEMLAYRYFVHGALLGLLWRELARVDGGEGFATVAWGSYSLGLLFFGMWRARPLVEKTALATLLLVVSKLFLVDLAALEAIYRILLFLGFGAVFLFFSYALQSWLRPRGTAGVAG